MFAEVDDQRQKMKKILQGERSHYFEMKKMVNAKEMEIRRLKRENLNIKSEIQACNILLKRAEQLSSVHNRNYLAQLECDKQELQKELKMSEEKLIDVLSEKKMHWVETMLTTTAQESRDLKDKNYVLLREKTMLADNHSKALKDLSKARLDSIKLKVLLGRIVDEHKIQINEALYSDIGVGSEIFENMRLEDYETESDDVNVDEEEDKAENESMRIITQTHTHTHTQLL